MDPPTQSEEFDAAEMEQSDDKSAAAPGSEGQQIEYEVLDESVAKQIQTQEKMDQD